MSELKTDVLAFAARATPGATAGTVKVYGKSFTGVAALAAQSSDGTEHQLTPGSPPTGSVTYATLNEALTHADGSTVPASVGPHSFFPSGRNTLSLLATTTYRMRGSLFFTTATISTKIGFGGTATYTSFYWATMGTSQTSAVSVATTPYCQAANSATAANATSNSAPNTRLIHIHGVFVVLAAGTFIPQITFASAPGAPVPILTGSFLEVTALGGSGFTQQGGWT